MSRIVFGQHDFPHVSDHWSITILRFQYILSYSKKNGRIKEPVIIFSDPRLSAISLKGPRSLTIRLMACISAILSIIFDLFRRYSVKFNASAFLNIDLNMINIDHHLVAFSWCSLDGVSFSSSLYSPSLLEAVVLFLTYSTIFFVLFTSLAATGTLLKAA